MLANNDALGQRTNQGPIENKTIKRNLSTWNPYNRRKTEMPRKTDAEK